MKNYIEISKYKVDKESGELLQVNATENELVIKKENSLNLFTRLALINSARILDVVYLNGSSSQEVIGFTNFRVYVNSTPILTKTMRFTGSNATTLSTSTSTSLFIAGEVIQGEEVSKEVGTDIRTVTLKNRFSPPSSGTREINTICVGDDYVGYGAPLNSILLDSPCYQASDEILIITYRYQYDYKQISEIAPFKDNLRPEDQYVIDRYTKNIGYLNTYEYNVLYGKPARFRACTAPVTDSNGIVIAPTYHATYRGENEGGIPVTFKGYTNPYEGFEYISGSLATNSNNGRLVSSIICTASDDQLYMGNVPNNGGYLYYPYAEITLRGNLDSCIQNSYFKQKAGDAYAVLPFYDLNNIAASLGSTTLIDTFETGNTSFKYTPNLATVVRTEVVSSGATGAATYKLSARYFSNFAGVTSYKANAGSPVLASQESFTSNTYLLTDLKVKEGQLRELNTLAGAGFILPLQLGEILAYMPYDKNHAEYGLWVHCLDLKETGFPIRLNSTTVSGFNANDIRGVTTAEDGTIFVACANTGLWKLKRNLKDSAAATVVQRVGNTGALDDTKCHAVNFIRLNHRFGSKGRIAAMFGNQLLMSEDGGATWSVYDSTTNPKFIFTENPDNILGINGNNNHIENIVGIVYKRDSDLIFNLGGYTNDTMQHKVAFWYKDRSDINNSVLFTMEGLTRAVSPSFHRLFFMYGSGNVFIKPTMNVNHPFTVIYYDYSSSNQEQYTYKPDTDTRTRIIGLKRNAQYGYHANLTLIDDTVNNETYVLAPVGVYIDSNSDNTFLESLSNLLNDTLEYKVVIRSSSLNYNIPVGRGLVLSNGTDAGINDYPSWSKDYLSYYHIGCDSRDFYVNNAMNFWYNYSYDIGSNTWKLADDFSNVTAKTTHTTTDSAILGLKNTFADNNSYAGQVSNFLTTDFVDTYVADGILKDDYTSLSFTGFVFRGLSKEGNTFTPSVVPANPLGVVTEPYTVSYMKTWENSYDGSRASFKTILFEPDYISMDVRIGSETIPIVGNQYATVGEQLVGNFDLTFNLAIDTQTSYTVHSSSYTFRTASPFFGFVDATQLTGIADAPYIWGIRVVNKSDTDSTKQLLVFDGNVYKGVDLVGFHPVNTPITIKRVGNNIELYLKDSLIDTTTIAVTTLQGMYRVVAYGYNSGSTNSYCHQLLSTGLANATITYTSNTLKAKIGSNVDNTGGFDPNLGYLHTEEFINGNKKIYLNGVEATIILSTDLTPPPAGSIKLCIGSGELIFSPADAGKVITGNWRIIPSVNSKGAN